jgi:acetyl-CoA carboxylase carboxyltransferase component
MEKGGSHISKEDQQKLLAEIQQRYEKETNPFFAAARLWVDGIIDPVETRAVVSRGIAMATQNALFPQFNPGVIQV